MIGEQGGQRRTWGRFHDFPRAIIHDQHLSLTDICNDPFLVIGIGFVTMVCMVNSFYGWEQHR